MPIAVMMESSENTMSMTMIWTITKRKALAPPVLLSSVLVAFDLAMNFMCRLGDQEQPAARSG